MIHFFTKISKDVTNLELTKELKRCGIPYRYFGCVIPFEYRSRLLFALLWYPKLFYHAAILGFRSMVLSRPRPTVVVLETDVDVIVFAALRIFILRNKPEIIYLSFIYTTRTSCLYNKVRRAYYGFVLRRCARILCHSKLEVENYAKVFRRSAGRFMFLPWGSNVGGWRNVAMKDIEVGVDRPLRILSAGRSGRDYPTLARAVVGENVDVTVVCDNRESLRGIKETVNLRILRDCHGANYFEQLRQCDVVVVPLAVEDISQGQMVVVQAMAYGKPIIVTRTPTIKDYLIEGEEALMVRRGDAEELRDAIRRFRDDHKLYNRIRRQARAAYVKRYSQAAFTKNLVEAIEESIQHSRDR